MIDLRLAFIVPGDLQMRSGGYGYDRRIIDGLRALGWTVDVRRLDGSFPFPTQAALEHAADTLSALPDRALAIIDGLALGAMPDQVEREATRLRLIGLVHHPLALETGLQPGDRAALERSECRALAATQFVVVTSRATAASLTGYGVPRERAIVVEPGTDPAPLARGSDGRTTALLCVAAVIPRKGHEVLFHALATLRERPWHLTCAGSTDRDTQTMGRLRDLLRRFDIDARVSFVEERSGRELAEVYDRADVFVLPTWHEGYGMAVAEALACGLPVISTPTGAISELVDGVAGILVPAGDVEALVHALRSVIDNPTLRARLADGAKRVRARLPTWDQSCRKLSDAIQARFA